MPGSMRDIKFLIYIPVLSAVPVATNVAMACFEVLGVSKKVTERAVTNRDD